MPLPLSLKKIRGSLYKSYQFSLISERGRCYNRKDCQFFLSRSSSKVRQKFVRSSSKFCQSFVGVSSAVRRGFVRGSSGVRHMNLSRMLCSLLCAAVLSVGAASRAFSESDGEMRLGLLGGLAVPTGSQSVKDNSKSGFAGGIVLGKELSSSWGIELTYDYFDVTDRSKIGRAKEYRAQLITLSGLYSVFPEKRWTPFLELGVGAGQARSSFSQAAFRASSGLEYFFSADLSARALVNYYFIGKDNEDDDEIHAVVPGLAVCFFFGGSYRKQAKENESQEKVQNPVSDEASAVESETNAETQTVETESPSVPVANERHDNEHSDKDKDGVWDEYDRCPNTPRGVNVGTNGCPVDSDLDGVFDYEDACPETPKGMKVNAIGCPKIGDKVSINLQVLFDSGSAAIRAKFNEDIDKVGKFLKDNTQIFAEVEGYTDDRGPKNSNLKLSQKRAENVRQMLIKNYGIDPARLVATGYGDFLPVASNATQKGRDMNRRVILTFSSK